MRTGQSALSGCFGATAKTPMMTCADDRISIRRCQSNTFPGTRAFPGGHPLQSVNSFTCVHIQRGRGDEVLCLGRSSVLSDVVPGSIPPGLYCLRWRFTYEGGAAHQSLARSRARLSFAPTIHVEVSRCARVTSTIVGAVTPRSSRSRRSSARSRAGPSRTLQRSRTRHPRTRRHSRCRHARAPASCRRAGCRCRRALHCDCVA